MPMKRPTFWDQLRYRFDTFMSQGTIALIGALLTATSILVLTHLKPEGSPESLTFGEALWLVTMRYIDTGNVAGDVGWSFRLIGFAVTLGGIFFASALIGILASGLQSQLNDLRRGRSGVIATGHTVILGWSPQVFTIVAKVAFANRYLCRPRSPAEGQSTCVAIVADKDKLEMEEEIRMMVPD